MRYLVTGIVTISVTVKVEADSEEEARQKANDASMQEFCYSCSRGDDDVWSTSGELDGEPTIESVRLLKPRNRHQQEKR